MNLTSSPAKGRCPKGGGVFAMKRFNNLNWYKNLRKGLRNNVTPQEIILWSRLRRSQLGFKFRRQHSIGKYIVDFCCPSKNLIIEVDGGQHDEANQRRYDENRTKYFESLGFKVLRFWDNDVNNNLSSVIEEIINNLG
ncbi:MAG TPA: endonuclease domain-containing protein [Candidatus Saccharimonadales bacterium]|nr:endonuclease domain-containing protein [Candidatus Saccharimonadales bacterium]